MMDKTIDRQSDRPQDPYPAEKARQGTIILRKPWQKITFFAGLGGFVLLVLLMAIWMIGAGA
jgi:hypothetical protein